MYQNTSECWIVFIANNEGNLYLEPFVNGSAGDGDVLGVEDDKVGLLRHGEDQLLDAWKEQKSLIWKLKWF